MEPTTEIGLVLNTQLMGEAGKAGKWPMVAYWTATGKLTPVKGAQIISLEDQDKQVIKGADRLCEIGGLKHFGDSRTKFYVPKTTAYATYETTIEELENQ